METEEFPMLHFGFAEMVTKRRHCLASDDEISSLGGTADLSLAVM
jgi:hypothetical protein